MNIFNDLKKQIHAVAKQALDLPETVSLAAITAELPRDASHGDMSTNAAMVLAKPLQKNPKELAGILAEHLKAIPEVTAVEVAGPGFINLRFAPAYWQKQLATMLEDGIGYGNAGVGRGIKTNIEYVSANPTGPMHIGHARGAVVGDALALLLQKAGYEVTKEYYINDAGSQIDTLARSAFLRYREACGENHW